MGMKINVNVCRADRPRRGFDGVGAVPAWKAGALPLKRLKKSFVMSSAAPSLSRGEVETSPSTAKRSHQSLPRQVGVDPTGSQTISSHHHPHDGPRTWIRGRMAPRGLRPAGFLIAPRRLIRRKANSGGVSLFSRNMWRMRSLYAAYSHEVRKVPQAVALLLAGGWHRLLACAFRNRLEACFTLARAHLRSCVKITLEWTRFRVRPGKPGRSITARSKQPAPKRRCTHSVLLSQNHLDLGGSPGIFTRNHPHDGPRTWIRGRMAPRRLRPAGLFLPVGCSGVGGVRA